MPILSKEGSSVIDQDPAITTHYMGTIKGNRAAASTAAEEADSATDLATGVAEAGALLEAAVAAAGAADLEAVEAPSAAMHSGRPLPHHSVAAPAPWTAVPVVTGSEAEEKCSTVTSLTRRPP